MQNIAGIRKEYKQQTLLETDVLADPVAQFTKWWDDALKSEIEEVNAMTLATADKNGMPAARIVLLKEFSEKGFVFFTNYESKKANQMAENERVTLLFWWKEMERQIRIEGIAQKIPLEESKLYFYARPKGSQISALISPQSKPVERDYLEKSFIEMMEKQDGTDKIPFPHNWGGYMVVPHLFEFWQGRPNRLHDRLQFSYTVNGDWKMERLGP